jgi:hypothetical protein
MVNARSLYKTLCGIVPIQYHSKYLTNVCPEVGAATCLTASVFLHCSRVRRQHLNLQLDTLRPRTETAHPSNEGSDISVRGEDSETGSLFSYLSCEARVPADHPLRTILAIVDEALDVLSIVLTRFTHRPVALRCRPRNYSGHCCPRRYSASAPNINS